MKLKLLNGKDIADFIKLRQAKQVRGFVQALNIQPKMVILRTDDDPTTKLFTRLKQQYGDDIGVEVENRVVKQSELVKNINELNNDESVHGVVVQLPLDDNSETDAILSQISPKKDIDGLGEKSVFKSATATAIVWLLNGYNVEMRGKNIVLVGQGRLVGSPLREMFEASGLKVTTLDEHSKDIEQTIKQADIVVSATGQPKLIKSDWIKPKAVVVDAGVAIENGQISGDLDESIYKRNDIKVTPTKGGVGPLTIAVLFDNLLRSIKN